MRSNRTIDPAAKEAVRHGEYIFPIQKYHTVLNCLHPAVTAHWHEESEFTVIRKGTCRYHMNLEDAEVSEGDLLFISPSILHSAAFTAPDSEWKSASMESDTFVFHLSYLGGNSADICSIRYFTPLFNQEILIPPVIRTSHPAYREVRDIFTRLDRAYDIRETGYELEVKSLLLQLLFVLLPYKISPGTETAGSASDGIDKIRNVLRYIEEHYPETISVDELASVCYFSKYYFMRFFKQHVGMTCVEYINNLRLEKAVELLEEGQLSILEAALAVGYHNLSYFHRAFLKKYHVTPKTFLKLRQHLP